MIFRPSRTRRALRLFLPAAAVLACAGTAWASWPFHLFHPAPAPQTPDVPYRQVQQPEPPPEPQPWPQPQRQSEPQPQSQPSAEDAVRQVLDAQREAWNRGDLDAFMTAYWSSPDLTFFSGGDRTSGWQATLDRYRKRYKADGKEMGRLAFSDVDVKALGADYALVRGRWQLELSKEKPGGVFTLVLQRLPEGWRIIHDHTSR